MMAVASKEASIHQVLKLLSRDIACSSGALRSATIRTTVPIQSAANTAAIAQISAEL
jgi:hypothetical protein